LLKSSGKILQKINITLAVKLTLENEFLAVPQHILVELIFLTMQFRPHKRRLGS
jgi:hypothetical protein